MASVSLEQKTFRRILLGICFIVGIALFAAYYSFGRSKYPGFLDSVLSDDRKSVGADNPKGTNQNELKVVAVGGGLTTIGLNGNNSTEIINAMDFLTKFLLTFCKSASKHFTYTFYFAYDYNDFWFKQVEFRHELKLKFNTFIEELCNVRVLWLSLVVNNDAGSPARAQNKAMMEAYLDGAEYFYRVNDDTLFTSYNWTSKLVEALGNFDPPNVGVVGPVHQGDNPFVMTYDFVHYTHVEIFGFYYPHYFKDWGGDTWMTEVYPSRNSEVVSGVNVIHTNSKGRRYAVDMARLKDGVKLVAQYQPAVYR